MPEYISELTETVPGKDVAAERYGFEKAKIRLFRLDKEDHKLLNRIKIDPVARVKLDDLAEMTQKEIMEWVNPIESGQEKPSDLAVAVTDKENQPIGFVNFYRHHPSRRRRVTEQGHPGLAPGTLDLEIAFGRDPNSKDLGLMSSGVRQALLKLQQIMLDLGNPPDKLGLVVVAYTKDNVPSQRLLEHCGFEYVDQVDYTVKDKDNAFWQLNWRKLNDLFHKKSSENLLESRNT